MWTCYPYLISLLFSQEPELHSTAPIHLMLFCLFCEFSPSSSSSSSLVLFYFLSVSLLLTPYCLGFCSIPLFILPSVCFSGRSPFIHRGPASCFCACWDSGLLVLVSLAIRSHHWHFFVFLFALAAMIQHSWVVCIVSYVVSYCFCAYICCKTKH